MRSVLTWGLVALSLFSQLNVQALAQGAFASGVTSGFAGAVGWQIANIAGKGIKAIFHHKRKDSTTDPNQSQNQYQNQYQQNGYQSQYQNMGPEDYYNRGLEDGYYRAREDAYYSKGKEGGNGSRGADYNYAQGQDEGYGRQPARKYRTRTSVSARRLADNRSDNQQQATSQKKPQLVAHQGKLRVTHATKDSKKKQDVVSQTGSQ